MTTRSVRHLATDPAPRVTILAAILLGIAGCGDGGENTAQPAQPAAPPAVGVVAVAEAEITPAVSFVGRVDAIDRVDVRARVTGFLEERAFDEGAQVQSDDLLFQIEQAPFQAEVDAAKAQLASAQADLKNAQLQLERGQELLQKKNIPAAEVDAREAARDMAKAGVLRAEATVRQAEINLSYTTIRSPIAGRIGRSTYTVGNLVSPDSGVLASIVSQDPIYVTFPVSLRVLLEVQKEAEAAGGGQRATVVQVRLPDGTMYDQDGQVNFWDVQVDPTTDTIPVRAQFPNPTGYLIENAFVTVFVRYAEPETALVIPQRALQADQGGTFALVVGADDKAERRQVVLADSGRPGVAAVTQGLSAGDRVIVDGIQRVRVGQVVSPSETTAPVLDPNTPLSAAAESGSAQAAPATPADQ